MVVVVSNGGRDDADMFIAVVIVLAIVFVLALIAGNIR